jgi:hypothetical protein
MYQLTFTTLFGGRTFQHRFKNGLSIITVTALWLATKASSLLTFAQRNKLHLSSEEYVVSADVISMTSL